MNCTPGKSPPMGQQEFAVMTRLLDSPVQLPDWQVGAVVVGVTLSVSVCTTIVEPLLKNASVPLLAPKTLNSASVQPTFRFTVLAWDAA